MSESLFEFYDEGQDTHTQERSHPITDAQVAQIRGEFERLAAEYGRKAGRREITAEHAKVKRAHELKAQGLAPVDIGKIIGVSRATVYRYLNLGVTEGA